MSKSKGWVVSTALVICFLAAPAAWAAQPDAGQTAGRSFAAWVDRAAEVLLRLIPGAGAPNADQASGERSPKLRNLAGSGENGPTIDPNGAK